LVAHEMAHQWFGDLVTCGNYHDVWMNEGFASYCEFLAITEFLPSLKGRQWMYNAQTSAMRDANGSVYVDDVTENNQLRIFSNNLSYKKGASILHVLRHEINNDSVFFKILRTYLQTHRYASATARDFIKVVNNITGKNFDWFLNQWFYGKGYPVFDVSWKQKRDTLSVLVAQKPSSEKGPFFKNRFDLKIEFENGDTTLSFHQETPALMVKITTAQKVKNVVFDPNGWLLKKVHTDKVSDMPEYSTDVLVTTPFTNEIVVSFDKETNKKVSLKLTDAAGKVYMNSKSYNQKECKIETTELPAGGYLLYISWGKYATIKKLYKPGPNE
jgi:aminopeptidase N